MNKIKSIIRSLGCMTLCVMMLAALLPSQSYVAHADSIDGEEVQDIIVTLGNDLNLDERATVLEELALTEEDLQDCTVLEVTNKDEHTYLDDYLDSSVIGSRALSSIKLVKTDSGSGINVETTNISYCTESMYINALATAGVEDADVTVVGPFSISGTAALVGVMKAYEEISGEQISDEVKDAATDELVTTGEIADSIDDKEKASELIAYIKNEVVAQGLNSTSDIQEIVEQAAEEMNISLTDEDVNNIVTMMKKIGKLDLDASALKEQAQSLYDKLENMDINIDAEQAKNFFDNVLSFFKKIYNKIIELFS